MPSDAHEATDEPSSRATVEPLEALRRLREGNLRFAQNVRSVDTLLGQSARSALVATQAPFAIVLGCSDSRGPAELVFDQGLGDLFVVRVAGNVVSSTLLGSIEFAVAAYGTSLVVVMGHTRCGAIRATFDAMRPGAAAPPGHVGSLVDRIRPAVESSTREGLPPAEVIAAATRANVRNSVEQVRRGSPLIEDRVGSGQLIVTGAVYALESGAVEFFDGVPS